MKKFIIFILVNLLMLPVFSSVAFGYSFAPVGQMAPSKVASGSLSLAFLFSPWSEKHIADVEVETLLAPVDPYFILNMKLSATIFQTTKHPFNFMFPNKVYWAPKVLVGAQYMIASSWYLYCSISPFSFYDTHYNYEFLSPYILYDFSNEKLGYGAYIMRFTVFMDV